MADELLTFAAAAKLYGLSPPTIKKWVDEGELPYYIMPVSERKRIGRSDLERFVQESKVSAKTES